MKYSIQLFITTLFFSQAINAQRDRNFSPTFMGGELNNQVYYHIKEQEINASNGNTLITTKCALMTFNKDALLFVQKQLQSPAIFPLKIFVVAHSGKKTLQTTDYSRCIIKQLTFPAFNFDSSFRTADFTLVMQSGSVNSSSADTAKFPLIPSVQKVVQSSGFSMTLADLPTLGITQLGPITFSPLLNDEPYANLTLLVSGESNSWLRYFQKKTVMNGNILFKTPNGSTFINISLAGATITSYKASTTSAGTIARINVVAKTFSFD